MQASKQARGRAKGRNWEAEIDMNTLRILCAKQVTDENLVCTTGSSTYCAEVTCVGRKSKGEGYVYMSG